MRSPRIGPRRVAAAGVDAGDELLAGEAALGEADRRVDQPLARLDRDRGLGQLVPERRHTGFDAPALVHVVRRRAAMPSGGSTSGPRRS